VRICLIFLIILFQCFTILSQEQSDILSPCEKCKKEIEEADERVYEWFKDLPCCDNVHNPIIIHKLSVRHLGTLIKGEFLDGKFLNKLEPNIYIDRRLFKKRKYLNSHFSKVCDSTGKIIASGSDFTSISCLIYNDTILTSYYQDLIDFVIEKRIKCLFNISMTPYNIVFGISEKFNWVFILRRSGWEMYSMKEFVDCCWDDFSKHKRE
jgi:hypothetical protein